MDKKIYKFKMVKKLTILITQEWLGWAYDRPNLRTYESVGWKHNSNDLVMFRSKTNRPSVNVFPQSFC